MEGVYVDRDFILGLGYEEVLDSVINAFKGFLEPGVVQPPRQELVLEDPQRFCGSMPCYLREYNVISVKLITYFFENPRLYGKKPFNSVVILFSGEDGDILAYLDGDIITTLRTAGMAAASTKYLSPTPLETISIIGVGVQGRMMVEMHLKLFENINKVKIYNRTYSKAVEYGKYLEEVYGVDSIPVKSLKEVSIGSDVVMAATSSPEPVVFGRYIEPSTHVISIGYLSRDSRELDDEAISKSNKIFVDSPDAIESGDIRIPIEKGIISREEIHLFSELVLERVVGREDEEEITLFKSVGTAVQDGYLAYKAYKKFMESTRER